MIPFSFKKPIFVYIYTYISKIEVHNLDKAVSVRKKLEKLLLENSPAKDIWAERISLKVFIVFEE